MAHETSSLFVLPAQLQAQTKFLERFSQAFHRVVQQELPCIVLSRRGSLRPHLAAAFSVVGYRWADDAVNTDIVVVSNFLWEDRHLPYLIAARHADSAPLVQYAFDGTRITLRVFGPLSERRVSPYVQFDIECADVVPDIGPIEPGRQSYAVRNGVAVGVYTWERFLRTSDVRHHESRDLLPQETAILDELLVGNVRRCDLLSLLLPALPPFLMLVGHDCYEEAVDANMALSLGEPLIVQPKGKLCHAYAPGSVPGEWSSSRDVFLSHMRRWLDEQLQTRWHDPGPTFIEEARHLMQARVERLDALPYMKNVIYRGLDSDPMAGWCHFRDALSIPVWTSASAETDKRVTWIFSLHSFSDEAFRWGMDHLWSLYDLFMTAARHICSAHASDRIVIRPHPSTLAFFTDPGLPERVASGESAFPTAYLDVLLQLRLCQRILALGIACELSPLLPARDVLESPRSVVVTRHGSLVIEAAWLNRCSVFSRIAPYASLFPDSQQFWDADSLRDALEQSREQVLTGRVVLPSHEDLLRYQAILDTPHGFRRVHRMGEVPYPESRCHPMRNFDDFAYGLESIADATARLRACLGADDEREAFERVIGKSALPSGWLREACDASE